MSDKLPMGREKVREKMINESVEHFSRRIGEFVSCKYCIPEDGKRRFLVQEHREHLITALEALMPREGLFQKGTEGTPIEYTKRSTSKKFRPKEVSVEEMLFIIQKNSLFSCCNDIKIPLGYGYAHTMKSTEQIVNPKELAQNIHDKVYGGGK